MKCLNAAPSYRDGLSGCQAHERKSSKSFCVRHTLSYARRSKTTGGWIPDEAHLLSRHVWLLGCNVRRADVAGAASRQHLVCSRSMLCRRRVGDLLQRVARRVQELDVRQPKLLSWHSTPHMAEIIGLAERAMERELSERIKMLEGALKAALQGAFLHPPDYQTVINGEVYQFFGFEGGILEIRIVSGTDRERTHVMVLPLETARKVEPTSQYAMHLKEAVAAIERRYKRLTSAA